MKALFSDVHGNLEALHAVLDDIAQHPVEDRYFLGDVLGYGPNPLECLDLIMKDVRVALLGNHDEAVLFGAEGYGMCAQQAVDWHRKLLQDPAVDEVVRDRRLQFLRTRPPGHLEDDSLYVHGSPRNPLYEYMFPEDVLNAKKMAKIGEKFDQYCFIGHTHCPGIFVEKAPKEWQFFSAHECGSTYRLDGRKTICNVGSVGQPRDGDWRACYVLLDADVIRYRRVEYDVQRTIKKIYAIPELQNFLGDRLVDGR